MTLFRVCYGSLAPVAPGATAAGFCLGRSGKLTRAVIALHDGDEPRNGARSDGQIDSETPEHSRHFRGIRMLGAKRDEPATNWRRLRRMQRGSPVDEEGDDPVGEDLARIGEAPSDHRAVRPLPAPASHGAESVA